ncbi:hypothetical protein C0Q70_12560 [Pomacea canaliculata]|uniref:Carrier domain-containing protein n=1 Tax=Pomacea canaliculata TaxID=400727 RepID=A0A2T7P1V3_POMCA|nr:hypothetical protein C0Q70_12560 [Pomacea canaliculata]
MFIPDWQPLTFTSQRTLSSQFLSRMSQRLSSSRELLDNPEFFITAEAVYVNRVRRVDKRTSVPLFREAPLDPKLMPRDICAKVDSDNIFNVRSVYIVVGGLTGLGWICVKFLARHGARNIAIIQRRTPSAEHTSNIEELTKHFDCIIHVFQVDVTKHNEVKQSLSSVGEKFNNAPLKGIFFGAAVVDDGDFFSMSRNKFDIVLAPKIKGAWNVHLLTRHLPLDFFVMHSSAASVFGNQGEANYAAGNAFLDGLAFYRRNQVKMDEERYFTRLQASGLQPLLQRFQSLGLQRVAKATFDKIDVLAVAKAKDPAARLELYHSYVLQIIRRVFSVDQSQVTLDTNLTDLGMDSVSSSMLLGQIYRDTSIKLNAVTLISGGVTVRSIAQNLNDNFVLDT